MSIFRNCQDINLAALQLALSKTEPRTLERYYLTGRQMVLGEDIVAATGPDWLDGPGLQFNSVLLLVIWNFVIFLLPSKLVCIWRRFTPLISTQLERFAVWTTSPPPPQCGHHL